MTHLLFCVLCFLECAASVRAVRYGEYSVGHMPQYGEQEDGDGAAGRDEYGDRSPDAPAPLDYKYEEEPHGKSDDLPVKDIVDERIWDKPIKKKRKPSFLRSGHNRDLDKYSLDELQPEIKSDKRFSIHGSEFSKRNDAKRSESHKHLKHMATDQRDNIDNLENNNDYVVKQDIGRADGDDIREISRFRHRSSTDRKPRRKPRDRALVPRGWRDNNENVNAEQDEINPTLEREQFAVKKLRKLGGESMNTKNKHNYDYDEYYDMKRVLDIKNRLPSRLKQMTVRTTEAESASYFVDWSNRRADFSIEQSAGEPGGAVLGLAPANTTTARTTTTTTARATTRRTRATSTAGTTTTSTGTTVSAQTKPMSGNASELSLAEKSRLSILKKAQRKESSRSATASTKPPVLLQVTRQMHTLVMVEPRQTGAHAQRLPEDTPERLRRARQLVRHRLVSGARSIHDLIDNWDEMVCDYIDVSLLDADEASHVHLDAYIMLFLLSVSLFLVL